ncbi:hypothetical protein AB0M94_28640 [Streptomyces xanthochromogenes]|uniref:hypothetical protein n=1 Tax=Streptomyces xanthochromogenes TaxID=67384 RepID=UPI00341E0018
MSRTKLTRHRAKVLATYTATMLLAGGYIELHLINDYGVPVLLALGCGLAVGGGFGRLAESLFEGLATTVFRCPDDACTFKVRLAHVDAGERRRWQEAAASHPGHELNHRP